MTIDATIIEIKALFFTAFFNITNTLLCSVAILSVSGITRSVIVNALRKLESAGVIESRSLGMKGTRIKIINSKFKEELGKMM